MSKIAVITLIVFIFFANSIIFAQTDDINVKITPSYKNCPTGSIDITLKGGFEPYTYVWSNGQTKDDISNLLPGEYTVTVTDDLCGKLEATFEVPSKGDYFYVSTDVIQPCNNANGTITVHPSADDPPGCPADFTFEWSHDATNNSAVAEDLSPGNYSVTITGPIYTGACLAQKPCYVVKNFKLEVPKLIDEIVVNNICMQGAKNGSLTVNLTSDATYPFTYMWSNGKPQKTIQDLDEGLYVVTITDFRGCTETAKAEITSQFDLTTKVINPSGCSGADGSISLQAISTNPNCGLCYSYQWDYMDKTTVVRGHLYCDNYHDPRFFVMW